MKDCWLLVIAGIHGEEADACMVLSRALRLLRTPPEHTAVVICANPDGVAMATRGNARGVDLNRNFPATNWSHHPVQCRMFIESPRVTRLSPGVSAASEPETQALLQLIKSLAPHEIVSLHSPLGCVDSPIATPLAQKLADQLKLPLVQSIGYETPGSLGSWCTESHISCITLELPRLASEILAQKYSPVLAELLFK